MTLRTDPPFRADQVGSLLRPAELADARAKWKAGDLPLEDLTALEDAHIKRVVANQEAIGLKGITDGEFRRDYWHLDFMWGFDGVEPSDEPVATSFQGQDFVAKVALVKDKVRFPAAGIMRQHFKFLADQVGQTAKITIPSPSMFRHRSATRVVSEEAYPDVDEFWNDLGQAYNDAVMDFAALGCRYIQLDDVNTVLMCDERVRSAYEARGMDPDDAVAQNIELNNKAIAGRPADMKATVHMCRGNYQSAYAGSGGYDAIAERLLAESHVDGFFMEYDDDRSGDFAPLRHLPKGKFAVLGIMTSKTGVLEPKDDLKRRIDEAAKYAPLEQLCISPQCGFASTHEGNKLSEDEQWRKLEHLVAVADEVWGD